MHGRMGGSAHCWPWPHGLIGSENVIPAPADFDKRRSSSANSGRRLAERHLKSCLHAGIRVTETSQRSPVKWSYKLGPLGGLDLADELWMSRFLMLRVSEEEGITVSFDPAAAVTGDGSGGARACVKFSTAETRLATLGMSAIQHHLDLLEASHLRHLLAYSKGNLRPDLTATEFNISIGGRTACTAVVVPAKTLLRQAGHYVDRRPPSNMDPYVITTLLLATTLELPLAPSASPPLPPPRTSVGSQMMRPKGALKRHCSGGLRAAFSGAASASVGRPCGEGFSLEGASSGLAWSQSTMNSEDVLIDELDRALLGPDTPPMYGTTLAECSHQEAILLARKHRGWGGHHEERCDESSSSGTSPMAPEFLPCI